MKCIQYNKKRMAVNLLTRVRSSVLTPPGRSANIQPGLDRTDALAYLKRVPGWATRTALVCLCPPPAVQ